MTTKIPQEIVKSIEAHKTFLKERYENAIGSAGKYGTTANVDNFKKVVEEESFVVKNVEPLILMKIVSTGLLKNYYSRSPEESQRKRKDLEQEGEKSLFPFERPEVDEFFYGQYKDRVHHATISLVKCKGLSSYGRIRICFDKQRVQENACLLEKNSFVVYRNYLNLTAAKQSSCDLISILPGCRAFWQDLSMLAVAKLACDIVEDMQKELFCRVLLTDTRRREQDDFIEVHIFGEPTLAFDVFIEKVTPESELTVKEKDLLNPTIELLSSKWRDYERE